MSTRKVDPDHLGEAIDEILTEYANTVTKDVKSAVEATGKMAAEILLGKKTPADFEIKTLVPSVVFNAELCQKLGIQVPAN